MITIAELDWATIATVVVAIAAVGGLILQISRKDKPWKRAQEKHNIRLTTLEEQVKSLSKRIDSVNSALQAHDKRDEKDFGRLEGKIEKLTDLMINLLSDNLSNSSKGKK